MKSYPLNTRLAVAFATAALLAATPSLADKPSWAGSDKGGNERAAQRPSRDDRK
jgi:hypothetical protein